MSVRILHGNCLDILPTLAEASVDSVVTDPPYELGFMGKKWDKSGVAFRAETWEAIYRVMKPGAHLLAFGGTRTSHRMVCAIEDAGFEIRDQVLWLYGSGFPKSLDISKAIDKAAGQIGQSVIGLKRRLAALVKKSGKTGKQIDAECGFRAMNYLTLPGEAKRPDPWTGVLPPFDKWLILKAVIGAQEDASLDAAFSAAEREIVGIRPVHAGVAFTSEGPTELDITAPATPEAAQWAGWGTALKPACEPIVLARKPLIGTVAANILAHGTGGLNIDACRIDGRERTDYGLATATRTHGAVYGEPSASADFDSSKGRWPANVAHDGSDEVMAAFAAFGDRAGGGGHVKKRGASVHCMGEANDTTHVGVSDTGTAARFFYSAKATAEDRMGSKHPTIKPLSLMDWLVKLITPPGGTVLDPFAGSGTTLLAADRLQMNATGIDMEASHVEDIRRRFTLDAPLFAEVNV